MTKDFIKILTLLKGEQKRSIIYLFVLLLVGMVFEILGIGMLLPIMTAITKPENLMNLELIDRILKSIDINTTDQFIALSLFLLVALYTIKSFFLLYLSFFQNSFIANLISRLSNDLFENYLNRDYLYHVKKNSSELIKNFQVEINGFSHYLISSLQLMTESILAFSVFCTLLYIELKGTILVMLFFGVLSISFHQIAKNKSKKWGDQRAVNDSKISKTIIEGLSGIKEILVLGRQIYFQNNLFEFNKIKAKLDVKAMTIRQVPRYYLELLSVISLVCFIAVLLANDQNLSDMIVILGVFIGATFRMLPSINRILSSLQKIKYHSSSLHIILNEFNQLSTNQKESKIESTQIIDFKESIELKNLSFFYDKGNQILNKINLKIKKGEKIGIIGHSGAGKTTLINIIVGLIKQTSGDIFIDNKLLKNKNLISWKSKIGYVPQDVYLIDDSIKSNIALGIRKDKIDNEKIYYALKQSQLMTFVNSLPKKEDTNVGERGVQLSGGQRQRIGIARALYNNSEILVLDEATSALDQKTELDFIKAVNNIREDKTILIVTHRLSTIENCDKIFKIENGDLKQTNKIYAK
ncbi:ABC transporter ATP-binding protein/permease [Flavobacteriaceae bacterium]|nr:ABC transporter ATP-binding protein/permease [Flavobacteriaceae bacterium]